MCLGRDLLQAALESCWRLLVRKCRRGQCEHRGNWLAQVMRSLPDDAWRQIRIGQIPPGSRRRVRCLHYRPMCHVPDPEQTSPQQNVSATKHPGEHKVTGSVPILGCTAASHKSLGRPND